MEPDPESPATKADLARLEQRLEREFATKEDLKEMRREMTLELAGEIARSAEVIIEHFTDQFRAGDDPTKAVGDRLDRHVADTTVHRAPRRARRS